jgi:membrane-associated phospholipid phosphatase
VPQPRPVRLAVVLSILLASRFALAQNEEAAPVPKPSVPPPPSPAVSSAPPLRPEPPPPPAAPSKPAFQLYAEFDVPVIGLGLVFGFTRFLRTTPPACAPLCNPRALNPIDRPVAGRWDPGWATASDVGVYTLSVGAGVLLALAEGPLPALNDAVVIAETGLLTTAIASLGTLPAERPRPYVYSDKAPLELRQSGDAGLSFISSHTAISFSLATSTFLALRRIYPRSAVSWVALGIGLAGASSVGVARVLAGRHFPTDVLAGAVVGSAIGVLVPSLHGQKVGVVPQITPTARGVLLLRAF